MMPARHDDSETNCGNGALLDLRKGRRPFIAYSLQGSPWSVSRDPANKEKSSLFGRYGMFAFVCSLKLVLLCSSTSATQL